jgi:hypothetical protein
MNISKQDTDKFKDKVEELIRKYYLTKAPVCSEEFLMDLCIYAEDFIMIYTSSGLMWWKKLYKH